MDSFNCLPLCVINNSLCAFQGKAEPKTDLD